jgi:hypothetical protein
MKGKEMKVMSPDEYEWRVGVLRAALKGVHDCAMRAVGKPHEYESCVTFIANTADFSLGEKSHDFFAVGKRWNAVGAKRELEQIRGLLEDGGYIDSPILAHVNQRIEELKASLEILK